MAPDYLFGTFSLILLYYLSLDLRLLNREKNNTMVLKKTDQRGNQKPYIGEQTIQWYLRKSTKEVIRSRKSRDRKYNGIKEKGSKR
jgi:phage terminase Nu1 subunit (DNA packaging protein)